MIIPVFAYILGIVMLADEPEMFAGLALAALLPTSGMTISWTMIFKGNVPAAKGLIVLLIFYIANLALSTMVGRSFFVKGDGIALVYGTVMRNLSISLGIALAAFGVKAGLIVTLAFIIQVQTAAWYGKIAENYSFFNKAKIQATGGEKV